MNATSCSLAMYDLPELRPQVRTLWLCIARHLRLNGIEAPGEPDWPADLASHWRDPALLLAQSCGYPLLALPERVRVVATPEYAAPGCEGASYRSALVVPAGRTAATLGALRGGVCAINGRDSNSGMNLLRAEVAVVANGERFFREVVETGSHLASMEAVARSEADLAAVDCVTLELLRRHRPALAGRVRVMGWTRASPGLPLVTAGGDGVRKRLREALAAVAADPELAEVRQALLIKSFAVLPEGAYEVVREIEAAAIRMGYPELA